MTSACPTVSATGCSDLGRFSAASNTRGGGVSSHPEAVPDAVRSGRSPRSRKPVVAVTGAASGLGAARRGPAGGQPGGRQGRRPRRPPRPDRGGHLAGARHPGPGAGDPPREGRHRGPPGARHRPGRRPPGPGRAQRPRHPDRAHRGGRDRRTPGGALHVGDGLRRPGRQRAAAARGRAAARGARRRPALRLARDRAAGRPGAAQPPRPAGHRAPAGDRRRPRHRQPAHPALRGAAAAGGARLDPALAVLPRRRPRGRPRARGAGRR